ncbi:hypothetical protein IMSHALPRED_005848 [Imshaugia aleurites]|uniref:Methyltransferase type 11 domain-containing protein n=1 Tax=Imshaugia aleurites TaxID=172621 RepID=A0A8H3FHX4_9LECA|nr:hypothetical protein IMSHALPRED_005848 [Imshaugia aleurites]
MSQPHPRSEHPPNTPFESPNPLISHDNHQDPSHFPSIAFAGDMAKTYNQRTGGCNITLANHLINLIAPSLPPPSTTPTLRILDNACGPLVLTTQCLLNPHLTSYPSLHISAVDLSPDFIAANLTTIANSPTFHAGGRANVDTAIMDGTSLSFPASTFDLSFTSLGIFAFPDPVAGARELYRTLKPGGVTAATTWKSVGWLPLLHEVEELLRPGQAKTRIAFLEPWCVPGKLAGTLREGGFDRVEEREVEGVAWWEGVEEAAFWMAATVRMLVGWGEEEKGGMEGGFRVVLERGGGVVRREGGRVGIAMVAFAGVGWK